VSVLDVLGIRAVEHRLASLENVTDVAPSTMPSCDEIERLGARIVDLIA